MTSSFAFFTLLLLLCLLYAAFAYWRSQPMTIVEAGSTGNTSECAVIHKPIAKYDKLMIGNKQLDMSLFISLNVTGSCMKKKGINPGDVVIARKIGNNFNFNNLKEGDILLIWLNDSKFKGYKMRIFESEENNNKLKTYYYDEEGNTQYSTNPHNKSSVKGIFEYIIDRNQVTQNS